MFSGDRLLDRDDIQGVAQARQNEPLGLCLDLLDRRFGFRHVSQGVRNRGKTDICGQQPIFTSVDLCLYDCHNCLYFDADELLQQGA